MEKISKRVSAIEEVNNNVKLLTEMVMNHSQGGASAHSSEDLMKVRWPPLPSPHPVLAPAGLTAPPHPAAPRSCTSAVSGCGRRSSDWPVTRRTMMRP